jgi:anti-anti-sigma factor
MEIKVESMKRCELITLSGQIDTFTAPKLDETLVGLIESGKRNFVINLRDVTFVSSAGLRAVLGAQVKVRKRIPKGEIVISEISADLDETFDLVGLKPLFRFYEGDVEAVGSF